MRFFTDCPPESPTERPPRASYVVILDDGTRIAVEDYPSLLRMLESLPRTVSWRIRTLE